MQYSNPAGNVPLGGVILFSGAVVSIPAGYLICDGNNGTPDLRNCFVVGAGDTYAVDAVGGAATHGLTIAELAAHTHTIDDSNAAGGANTLDGQGGALAGSVTSGSTGSGDAHNNLPPYYALAYIMRV